ncbi:MAG TPA: hypothetical protein VFE34_00555 [Dongiaceae bacterium]|nr:hypothetical protein [Dongiaceae bacterium]
MSRTFRQRLLVGVGAAIALASLPLFALADTEIQTRGWTHEKYGRLVLDDAARLATSVSIKDHKLVIEFSEPVSVELRDALQKLATYVQGPASAQGRTLELTLARPATLSQFVEEGKLVLDLRPADTWPGERPDEVTGNMAQAGPGEIFKTGAGTPEAEAPNVETKAEPPRAEPPRAEPPKAETPPPGQKELSPIPNVTASPIKIVARHGDHGTYTRLAIDWPSKIGYRVTREGDQIAVTFTAPANIDLAPARQNLPKQLVQIAAANDSVARIYLTLAPGASLRDFRLGRTVVLDIVRPPKLTAAAPALRLPGLEQAAQEQVVQQQASKEPDKKPQSAVPAPAGAPEKPKVTGTIAEPPAPAPEAPKAETDFALKSLPSMPEPAAVMAEPSAKPSEATQVAPPPMPAIEQAALPPRAPVAVPINVTPTDKGTKIILAWPENVAAAAFRRNGALWLAFDMPASDVKALTGDARIAKLGKASRIDVTDATIIRIVETSPLGVTMRTSGRSWIVDLVPSGKDGPTTSLEQRRENLADGASSLLLRTNGPGRVASVTDPSGGRLYVVPVRPAGLGIAEQAGWPEFQLLPSYQGVVIASLSDAVTVDSMSQGVVITTKPQGTLAPIAEQPGPAEETGEQIASQEQQTKPAGEPKAAASESKQAAPKEGEPLLASVPGLFDLPTWRRGGEATFTADQRQLEGAVTDADEPEKAAARLALGEFYFAHGLVDEADDALSQIGREGRDQLDQRELALLTSAVQVLDGELDKARAGLADKALAGVAETNLFQGLLAAREQKWEEAAKHLTDPLPNIADYPKPVREDIYISAGTALNKAGNPIAAQRFADALRLDEPERDARDRLTYLDGQIKLRAGDRERALGLWASLKDSPLDDVKALSQFDLVEERLKGGELKSIEAIAPLEALRFVNRGGDFEFKLLRKLGTLYLDNNQPRKGLVTLRNAAANFPDRPEAKEIGEQMSTAFRDLYLDDGANRLSPLTAVALYDEFRELTPAGADGDRMISLLADRLVNVDLLNRAAELLDTLVKKRLTGLDKVHAGTRLASIRMLDQKPELALQALTDSEIDDVIPPDMAAERKRLEARATFDSGDTLGGIRMLAGDDSLDAKWLRADMQWRVREWPAAATALGELIDGEEQAMADERAALKVAMDPTKDPAASVGSVEAEEELNAKQEQHFKNKVAPLVLNRAVALSLASDRRGMKALANQYAKRMEGTEQAKAFAMLTAPDNGLVESVSAEMSSVNRIDAFVTDYRERLKKASLGEGASGS